MLCDVCGANQANFFLKALVNQKTTKLNLCEPCAREKGMMVGGFGIQPGINFDIANIIGSLTENLEEQVAESLKLAPKSTQVKCPRCNLNFSAFQSSGFLGCSDCYSAFYPSMKSILKKIHGATTHNGKKYSNESAPQNQTEAKKDTKTNAAKLKLALESAIKQEAFEEAAILRDKIKELER